MDRGRPRRGARGRWEAPDQVQLGSEGWTFSPLRESRTTPHSQRFYPTSSGFPSPRGLHGSPVHRSPPDATTKRCPAGVHPPGTSGAAPRTATGHGPAARISRLRRSATCRARSVATAAAAAPTTGGAAAAGGVASAAGMASRVVTAPASAGRAGIAPGPPAAPTGTAGDPAPAPLGPGTPAAPAGAGRQQHDHPHDHNQHGQYRHRTPHRPHALPSPETRPRSQFPRPPGAVASA